MKISRLKWEKSILKQSGQPQCTGNLDLHLDIGIGIGFEFEIEIEISTSLWSCAPSATVGTSTSKGDRTT